MNTNTKTNAMRLAALVLAAVQLLISLFNQISIITESYRDSLTAEGVLLFYGAPWVLLILSTCGRVKKISHYLFAAAAAVQGVLVWLSNFSVETSSGVSTVGYSFLPSWELPIAICCWVAAVVALLRFKPRVLSWIVGALLSCCVLIPLLDLPNLLAIELSYGTGERVAEILSTIGTDMVNALMLFAPFVLCLFAGESDAPFCAADYRGAARWITALGCIPFLIDLPYASCSFKTISAYLVMLPMLLFTILSLSAMLILFFALRREKSRLYLPALLLLAVSCVELARNLWTPVRLIGSSVVDIAEGAVKGMQENGSYIVGVWLLFVGAIVLIGVFVFVLVQILLKRKLARVAKITAFLLLCESGVFLYASAYLLGWVYGTRTILLCLPIALWLFGQTRTNKINEADTVTPLDEAVSATE